MISIKRKCLSFRTYEYVADKRMFANGTENKENSCYNPSGVNLPSGTFNASVCRSSFWARLECAALLCIIRSGNSLAQRMIHVARGSIDDLMSCAIIRKNRNRFSVEIFPYGLALVRLRLLVIIL